jgi:hypothetical protein
MPWTVWIATFTSLLYSFFASVWLARLGMIAGVVVPLGIAFALWRRVRFAPSLTLFAILGFMWLLGSSQNPALWPDGLGTPGRVLIVGLLVLVPATPFLMLLPVSKRYFARDPH